MTNSLEGLIQLFGWIPDTEFSARQKSRKILIGNNLLFTENNGKLHKIKSTYYAPKKVADNINWWPLFEDGTITTNDIDSELSQLSSLGLNTVSINFFYDDEYIASGGTKQGFYHNGSNIFNNSTRIDTIKQFLTLCFNNNLNVIPSFFTKLSGYQSASNATALQSVTLDNLTDHKNYISWLINELVSFWDIITVFNLFDEPDNATILADREMVKIMLEWLTELKEHVKSINERHFITITSTSIQNVYKSFIQNYPRIYDLVDIVNCRNFLWADNDFSPLDIPKTSYQTYFENNVDNKPLMIKTGWPANNDGNGDEFVPNNQEFDSPIGSRPETPHSERTQLRAYREIIYWLNKYEIEISGVNFLGGFDTLGTKKNPFGFINNLGVIRVAANTLTNLWTDKHDTLGEYPQSLTDFLSKTVNVEVNGIDTLNNSRGAMAYIPGTHNLVFRTFHKSPFSIVFEWSQRTTSATDGAIFKIQNSYYGEIELRRDENTNTWKIFYNSVEITSPSYTPSPDTGITANSLVKVKFEITVDYSVKFFVQRVGVDSGFINLDPTYTLSLSGVPEPSEPIDLTVFATNDIIDLENIIIDKNPEQNVTLIKGKESKFLNFTLADKEKLDSLGGGGSDYFQELAFNLVSPTFTQVIPHTAGRKVKPEFRDLSNEKLILTYESSDTDLTISAEEAVQGTVLLN